MAKSAIILKIIDEINIFGDEMGGVGRTFVEISVIVYANFVI